MYVLVDELHRSDIIVWIDNDSGPYFEYGTSPGCCWRMQLFGGGLLDVLLRREQEGLFLHFSGVCY